MTERTAILVGMDPDKVLVLELKDERGNWHTCRLTAGKAIWPGLNGILSWLGMIVKVSIEAGEVEAIELA